METSLEIFGPKSPQKEFPDMPCQVHYFVYFFFQSVDFFVSGSESETENCNKSKHLEQT